jgi:hypothetical protein
MTRHDHAERAQILRRVLAAFGRDDDRAADRVIRRRIEGAVIAEELDAGELAPRLAATEPGDAAGAPTG